MGLRFRRFYKVAFSFSVKNSSIFQWLDAVVIKSLDLTVWNPMAKQITQLTIRRINLVHSSITIMILTDLGVMNGPGSREQTRRVTYFED